MKRMYLVAFVALVAIIAWQLTAEPRAADLPRQTPAQVATALGLPVFPGATPDGARTLSLPSAVAGASLELTTAEFEVNAAFDDVQRWYGGQLSSAFRRHDDEYVVPFGADGFDFDVDGVIYAHEQAEGTIGVIVERADATRSNVNLFRARVRR